jgi:hypothetical protein
MGRAACAGVDDLAGGNRRDLASDGRVQFDLDDEHGYGTMKDTKLRMPGLGVGSRCAGSSSPKAANPLATTAPAFSNWSTDVLPGAAGTDSTDRYVRHPILAGKVTVRKRRTSNRNDVSLRQFRKAVLVADRMCGTPFVLFVNVVVGVSSEPQVPRIAAGWVVTLMQNFKWSGVAPVSQPIDEPRGNK